MLCLLLCGSPAFACTPPPGVAALGARMLDDALTLRFAQARSRVPGFGAWAYGWAQGYATGWRILGQAASHGFATIIHGRAPAWPGLSQAMAQPVEDAFQAQVIGPAFADGGFAADMAHLAQSLGEAWPAATDLAPRLRSSLPAEPRRMLADGADIGTVQLRSARPLAMRAGGLLLQATEGAAVIGAGTLGWSLAGGPAAVLASVGGIGAFWALDWAINRIDAGLHRAGFEAHALAAIDHAEAATRQAGLLAIETALAACP